MWHLRRTKGRRPGTQRKLFCDLFQTESRDFFQPADDCVCVCLCVCMYGKPGDVSGVLKETKESSSHTFKQSCSLAHK